MDLILYNVVCFIARKKIFLNVSYFLGTIVFVSLSYNTANKLSKVPVGFQLSLSESSVNQSQISNISLQYEERLNYLGDKCGHKNNPSAQTVRNVIHFSGDILNHLGFVVRSHSLYYCSIPKVATRTLLTYITYLHIRDELLNASSNNSEKNYNVDYLKEMLSTSIKNNSTSLLSTFLSRLKKSMETNSTQLDLWSMYQKNALPSIRLRTLSDPMTLFSQSFTRAIFVRHPLERLASAYVDKITSLNAEPFSLYDSLRRSICRRYSSFYLTPFQQQGYRDHQTLLKQINEPCEKVVPSFQHFVEYIMSDSSQVDVHWRPYSILCHVCTFKYNFIGKYETIQDDLNDFRSKFGLNLIDPNLTNHFSNKKTKEYYKLMYSTLSYDLICNLKHFYNDDLNLFNYTIEDYLTKNQTIQCPSIHYRRF